jgi:hypothetical protein
VPYKNTHKTYLYEHITKSKFNKTSKREFGDFIIYSLRLTKSVNFGLFSVKTI